MSQAPAPVAAPGPTPARTAPTGIPPVSSGTPSFDIAPPVPSRTPWLLQRLQVVVALAVLIAGAMSAWVIADLRGDLASAPNLAQQYARLGEVQHDLSAAARLAKVSVILGEAASGANATAAIDQVVAASGLLVESAKDRPQDAEALQAIGGDTLRYSLTLASAVGSPRAQALPRLAVAQKQLDALLGQLDDLQAQLAAEADARPWSQGTPAVWLVCLAMVAVVVWASWVVAQRSHRVVNLGLAAAVVALLALLSITAAAQGAAISASDTSRSTQFSRVVNTSAAVQHLDAAQQVLTTAVLTQTWDAAARANQTREVKSATVAANKENLTGLSTFTDARDALDTQMSKGEWKAAATALTDTAKKSLSGAAQTVRDTARDVSDSAVTVASSAPTSARATLVIQLVLVILIALVGAALGVLGLYQRLREYR